MQHESTFIVGCGSVGKRVASLLLKKGHDVTALTHRYESQKALKKLGLKVVPGDLDQQNLEDAISSLPPYIFYFETKIILRRY